MRHHQPPVKIPPQEIVTAPELLQTPGMWFYCKNCRALVEPNYTGKKFKYQCATCGSNDIAFGTEKSIRNFYRLPGAEKRMDK